MRDQKPDWQQKIAGERIEILLNLARKEFEKNPARSRRYVELARKIGMRYRVRMSADQKEKFCKKCGNVMILGKTMERFIEKDLDSVVVKCLECGHSYRKAP